MGLLTTLLNSSNALKVYDQEFVEALKQLLASEEVKQLLSSLLAQANAA